MRLLVVAALIACSHEQHSTPTPAPPPAHVAAPPPADAAPPDAAPPDAAKPPSPPAVCAYGIRHSPAEQQQKLPACADGLICCYPCGIPGCDSVCMPPAQCGPRP